MRPNGRGARAPPRTRSPCRRASPGSAGAARSACPSSRASSRTRARSRSRLGRCPSACAATPGRERSRIRMAIRNPSPSSPSRFPAGMRQPSKVSSPVVEPEIPIFGSSRATSKPGASVSTTNAEIPRVPGLRVGLREDRVDVRDARVRDEALRAVEDVLVALAAGGRPHRRRVGAGARLGERVGGEPLAGGEPRQPALLLLLRPRELEPERAELLHRQDQRRGRADLRDLLDRDEREQGAGAGPPCSSAKKRPKRSFSRKSSTTSQGNSCEASISAARGAIRSRASCRTRSRSSRCSPFRTSQAISGKDRTGSVPPRSRGSARAGAGSTPAGRAPPRRASLECRRRRVSNSVFQRRRPSGGPAGVNPRRDDTELEVAFKNKGVCRVAGQR